MKRLETRLAIFAAVVLAAFSGALAQNEDANKALFDTVRRGSVNEVCAALQEGVDVNEGGGHDGDYYYEYPIQLAAAKGNPEIVKMLLEAGADKTIKDGDSKLPIDHVDKKSSNGTRIYWMLK